MARVFLSYDREDAGKARLVAQALERAGHSVWWDSHIKGGAQYSKEIEQALKRADAVVVLWSVHSVDSAWVRDEAAAGRDSGQLVPARLDESEPPLGFRQYHTIDLSRWKGRGRGPRLADLLGAINALTGESVSEVDPATGAPEPQAGRRRPGLVHITIGLVMIAGALFLWRSWSQSPAAPVVAVRAANPASHSKALARDLFVGLGNVGSSRSNTAQLIDENAREKPDLILEVSAGQSGSRPSANLTLLRGKDRQLLAANAFEATNGSQSDLKQSLAIAAARLIACATEAMAPGDGLRQDLQKSYIDSCGRFGMLYGTDDITIILPRFQQITEQAPGFVPAWRQLVLAGASLLAAPSDKPKPSAKWLEAQVAGARRADPNMPEIGLAELELIPIRGYAGRLRRIDQINTRYPDHPYVLEVRSRQLMLVGRMNEAVADAEQAAMLDPISPFARSAHIRALAYSGRLPRAFQELEESAPLALGAKALIEPRFRLNMRYGDPRVALAILRTYGTSKQHEAFLTARIGPTPANIERAVAVSRATVAEFGFFASHVEVLSAFGRHDEVNKTLMGMPLARTDQMLISTLFRPTLKALRQNPRFLRVAERFGLLDYWRASGKWPDFCFEPDLPYDCKAEAAKIA